MLSIERQAVARRTATTEYRKFRGIALLLIVILVITMLSACGGKEKPEENPGAAKTEANTQAAVQSESSKENEKGNTIKIKHGFGETEVPVHPQRVAVFGLEDIMLSLEAPMVYAYDFKGYYLDDQLQKLNISLSGSADFKPNPEAILEADPDLIIVQQYSTDEKGYAELSKIAPTIAFAPDDWKSSIVEIGKALGLEDKAQAVIQAYEEKLKQAQDTIIQAVGSDKTVAFVRPSDKNLQVFFPSFNLVYTDFGLKPDSSIAELQKKSEDDWGVNLSLEELPLITADYVFAIYGGSIDTEDAHQEAIGTAKQIEQLQIWKSLPAVKKNQVFKVSSRHWMSSGPIAESMEADDVVNAVTGKF